MIVLVEWWLMSVCVRNIFLVCVEERAQQTWMNQNFLPVNILWNFYCLVKTMGNFFSEIEGRVTSLQVKLSVFVGT